MAVATTLVLPRWCNNGDGATMDNGKVGATMGVAMLLAHCWLNDGSSDDVSSVTT
jgi:hypothetical protein